jgi:hypothetical protein
MSAFDDAGGEAAAEPPVSAIEKPERIHGTMLGRLVGGSAVSLVGFGLTVVQAILQVPLLLAVWPAETFAAWVTALGMHAFLVSCDIGFHSFVGVEVIMTGLRREAAVRCMFSAAFRLWAVLSVVQLLVLSAVWMAADLGPAISSDTAQLLRTGRAAFAILVVQWIAVGSTLRLLCRVLLAGGQTILFQWFGVIHRTMLLTATVAAAWGGFGITGVAVAYSCAATLAALACIAYVVRRYPATIPRWADGSWAAAWELFRRSTGLTVSSMLEQSAVGGLTTAVAGCFHELQTAAFATMRSLANFVTQAAGVVLNPTVPEFGRTATREGIHKAAMMIDSAFILGTTSLAVVVSVAAPGIEDLYAIWTRHELPFDATLFIGLVAAVLGRQVGVPFHFFLHGTNRVQPQFLATVLRTAVLYGSLPFMIGMLGLAGVGASMACAEFSAAVYFAVVVDRAFREYGGSLRRRSTVLAGAQAAVAVCCLGAVLLANATPWLCVGLALVAHAVLFRLQLRSLPRSLVVRAVGHVSLGIRRLRRGTGCA